MTKKKSGKDGRRGSVITTKFARNNPKKIPDKGQLQGKGIINT
jgi:hypothetical protein